MACLPFSIEELLVDRLLRFSIDEWRLRDSFLPLLRLMVMVLQRWSVRLSLGNSFPQLPPLFVVLIAEEFMVHMKIHHAHSGHVIELLVLFEYIPKAIPVGSSLAKSCDQA